MAFRRAGMAGLLALAAALGGAAPGGSPQQSAAPALRPTAHPPVPEAPDRLWLAPTDDTQASAVAATYARLQEGVKRHQEGDDKEALPLLTDPAWEKSDLADYARYYAGRARLGLEQYAAAQQDFMAVMDRNPAGYLSEGAALGAAEAAEGLDQPEVALRLYETLADRKPLAPELIWLKIGQMAAALGDKAKAAEAFTRVYYEYPLSDQALQAATELRSLKDAAGRPGTKATYPRDLKRADALYGAGRYADARAAYLDVLALDEGDERVMVELRLASCELSLKRYRSVRDRLRRVVDRRTPYQAEARYLDAKAARGLGRQREFVTGLRDLVRDFPDSPWSEAALDALGTSYIVLDEDAKAADVFKELYEQNPSGRYAERAAWKAGWWAWRHGDYAGAAHFFEGAAATFPRSDYRPAYLYWSGRGRDRLRDAALARDRFGLDVADYGSSYYGRLAARELERLGPAPQAAAPAGVGVARAVSMGPPRAEPEPPPTASRIRLLVAAGLYDTARNEIDYARRQWGGSTLLDASWAYILYRQGDLRRAIPFIKRAYPQYLTADGGRLPTGVQKIIFPLDYWSLIRKYAGEHGLDPYLVAAIIGQESAFDASARSGANAYGLMQLVPATGRRVGRTLGLRRVTTRSLIDPDVNLRLGTALFASLLRQFGQLHLALAAYNAGEQSVEAWIKERPGLSVEEFIADIPFPETQGYVRRILGTVVDYRRLYGADQAGHGK